MRSRQSVLFIRPDYHCSFFYRDELRKRGWKADIFVPWNYPELLLFEKSNILRPPALKINIPKITFLNHLLFLIWWFTIFWRYHYHIYYGRPQVLSFADNKFGLTRYFGKHFQLELWLAKLFGVKLIFLPTGCHDEESKKFFSKLDGGNICNNCGFWSRCLDDENNLHFSRIRHYFDFCFSSANFHSSQFSATPLKWKSINFESWSPNLVIPEKYLLSKTSNLRILHSTFLKKSGRNWKGRNIKGSPYILEAIQRLKKEGYPVEYFYINDKPSNQMRFYQAQADIVVEQLIYGWWGSTFVEASALGKPVVCYLRPAWKDYFLKTFPEYKTLPIIEANTDTIYDVLKELVLNPELRKTKGAESRKFAEKHFNLSKNVSSLITQLEAI